MRDTWVKIVIFLAFYIYCYLQSMAEENRFFKHPRIAWGSPSHNKNAEQFSKSKVLSYLSEPPQDNYIEPSKVKFLVPSSLSKLTPRSTCPSVRSKNLYFGRHKSSCSSPSPPTSLSISSSSVKRHLTNQPPQHTSLPSLPTADRDTSRPKELITFVKKAATKIVIRNLAQVLPVNTDSMDSKKDNALGVSS